MASEALGGERSGTVLGAGRSSALLILIAAILWGISGGLGGMLVARGWDPLVVTFYRGGLALAFVAVWFVATPGKGGLRDWRLWAWSALAGAGVAGTFGFYFAGMVHSSVAVAATLLYSAPVFVFLVGFLTGGERVSAGKIAGLLAVAVGVALLTGFFDAAASGISPLGLGIGLASGVSYATFIFGFRNAARYGSVQTIMVASFAVETLILFTLVRGNAWTRMPDAVDLGLIAFLGIFGGGISFVLYIIGLRRTRPAMAAVTAMAEPITASAFGFIALGQTLTPYQAPGAALIIATVTALNVRYQNDGTR